MALTPDNDNPGPSQLPPPGWYPDPAGAGLRWWDGERWTEQVGGPPPTAASQPPPGVAPAASPSVQVGDGGRFRVGLAVLAVALVGGLIALIAAGSGDDAQAAFAECQRDSRPTFTAMQELGSHLDVGVRQADYAAEVGDVQATFDRLDARPVSPACQPIVTALGEAMDAYAQASSEWNDCIVSAEEFCGEGAVQERWSDADFAIARAKQRLQSLSEGGDAVATAELEAAQGEADALAKEQAHLAQVVMETYATDHEGSYAGATPGKLRAIEPSLPADLEVTEAGIDYFSISIPSKGGNWFGVDREIGGELVFECGESGRAGCPGNGRWQ
jgi:hypothetical protein